MLVLDPRVAAGSGPERIAALAPDGLGFAAGIAVASGTASAECQGWTMIHPPGEPAAAAPPAEASGRFAVDAALRAAADTLDYTKHPAHMVLVASGGSQCISVACSLSQTLARDGRDFRVDVVGLNPSASGLRCIAENTGGTYQEASKGDLSAAVAGLLALAQPEARQNSSAGAELTDEEADHRNGPKLAGHNPDMEAAGEDNGNRPQAEARNAPDVAGVPVPLPAPRRQQASAEPSSIEIAGSLPGIRQADRLKMLSWVAADAVDLAAAPEPDFGLHSPTAPGMHLQAVAAAGTAPLTSELSFEVLAVEGDGAYRLVGRSWSAQPVFDLPAGDYVARVTHRGVVREQRFQSRGDGVQWQTIDLNLGYVSLAAAATPDAPPLESDLRYTLRRADGGGAPIVRLDPQPALALPAGKYEISIASGGARAVSTVQVVAGETIARTFDLRLGYLRLHPPSGSFLSVLFRVEADAVQGEGLLAEARSEKGEALLLRLPAGRHIAVAEKDGRKVRRVVTVAPGRLTQVVLEPQTAQMGWGLGQF